MSFNFIEKRQHFRLPFFDSLLMTDGKKTVVGDALNISRGGLFLKTLNSLPLDFSGYLSFLIPGESQSICVKAKVAHLVFDRQRAEVDCGMGIRFIDPEPKVQSLIDTFIEEEKKAYLALAEVLRERRPQVAQVEKFMLRLKHLRGLELSSLRYRVERICTIFEDTQNTILGKAGGV